MPNDFLLDLETKLFLLAVRFFFSCSEKKSSVQEKKYFSKENIVLSLCQEHFSSEIMSMGVSL